MKRIYLKLIGLFMLAGLVCPGVAQGKGTAPKKASRAVPQDDMKPGDMKPKEPPGPARRLKILLFVSLTTRAILATSCLRDGRCSPLSKSSVSTPQPSVQK